MTPNEERLRAAILEAACVYLDAEEESAGVQPYQRWYRLGFIEAIDLMSRVVAIRFKNIDKSEGHK